MFACFHKILPWHLPFKNIICNIVVVINFYIFIYLNLSLCLSWFPMTSLSCDCHVTEKHAVIHPSPDS